MFKTYLGRILLVMYCVLEGLSMIFFTKSHQKILIDGYGRFGYQISENFGSHLIVPTWIILLYSYYIIWLIGLGLIISSFLLIFGCKSSKCILSIILLSIILVIHNPLLYHKRQEIEFHSQMALLSLGLISGFSLI